MCRNIPIELPNCRYRLMKLKAYEIKIGKTVYVISHDYRKSDFTDIIADYLADKIPIRNKATAA